MKLGLRRQSVNRIVTLFLWLTPSAFALTAFLSSFFFPRETGSSEFLFGQKLNFLKREQLGSSMENVGDRKNLNDEAWVLILSWWGPGFSVLSGKKHSQPLPCLLMAAPPLTPAITTARRKHQQGCLLSHRRTDGRRWHSYLLAQCLKPTKQSIFDREISASEQKPEF